MQVQTLFLGMKLNIECAIAGTTEVTAESPIIRYYPKNELAKCLSKTSRVRLFLARERSVT